MKPTEEEIRKRREFLQQKQNRGGGFHSVMHSEGFGTTGVTQFLIKNSRLIFGTVSVLAVGAIAYAVNDVYARRGVCLTCDAQARVAAKMYGKDPVAQLKPVSLRTLDFSSSREQINRSVFEANNMK